MLRFLTYSSGLKVMYAYVHICAKIIGGAKGGVKYKKKLGGEMKKNEYKK